MPWIDTHCHLDAAEFDADRDAVRQKAKSLGVDVCVIPAVMAAHFDEVRLLAHRHRDAYALGIHPLFTPQANEADLATLDVQLHAHRDDPRLVAVGEIGLDGFVPDINTPEAFAKQTYFYEAQLQLAQRHHLPVILHVRRSADLLLKGLRQTPVKGGIAHAFNGSLQQAQMFIELGFKLGFGGATNDTAGDATLVVFDRAGTTISVEVLEDTKVLLLSGQPIDEAIVGYGPFVMNSEAEIRTAINKANKIVIK